MSIPPTLLLADDSLTIQRVVSLTFADQPVRVVVAKDGQDAINRMATDRPDLVLADTNMPCVDGYELARWVRQQPHLSAVPVLLLAGVTDPVDEQRLHDSGANGVLEKPFEPSHVISRVKELLGMKGTPPAGATRLVTTADTKPTPRSGPAKPGSPPSGSRVEVAAPAVSKPAPAAPPESPAIGPAPAQDPVRPEPALGGSADVDAEMLGGTSGRSSGAGEDWFSGPAIASSAQAASLAAELGVSDMRFYGQGDDIPPARGLEHDFAPESAARSHGGRPSASSMPADVFESLLAAEQGDAIRPVFRASPEFTPETLDQLATRVVERLRPQALRDELQRGLGIGLREAVAEAVRESVAAETRAAVAEAVQAAVNGGILGTIRGAVNEAVAAALPAAVEQTVAPRVESAVRISADQAVRATIEPAVQERLGAMTGFVRETVAQELRQAVAPVVQQAVRDIVGHAVRDAVAVAVPSAVLEAVRGDGAGLVRELVRDTAERLVTEEIARIRARRPA